MKKNNNCYNEERKNLIKARCKMGYSQDEIADRVGISRPFYNQIESGKRNPSYNTILKISKLLNIDVRNW